MLRWQRKGLKTGPFIQQCPKQGAWHTPSGSRVAGTGHRHRISAETRQWSSTHPTLSGATVHHIPSWAISSWICQACWHWGPCGSGWAPPASGKAGASKRTSPGVIAPAGCRRAGSSSWRGCRAWLPLLSFSVLVNLRLFCQSGYRFTHFTDLQVATVGFIEFLFFFLFSISLILALCLSFPYIC